MNFDHIFILTYGRSGSTLLQGVLNSIPGVQIRGENGAVFRHLFNAAQQLETMKQNFSKMDTGSESPWFGISSTDIESFIADLGAAFVKNVLVPSPGTHVVGFKEIRFAVPHLELELEHFRRFFTRPGFIINTRNIEDAILSNERARHNITPPRLRASDAALRTLAEAGHADVFHVHYDDYVHDPHNLRRLFDFLGADFDLGIVHEVLSRKHSSKLRDEPGLGCEPDRPTQGGQGTHEAADSSARRDKADGDQKPSRESRQDAN